MGALSPRYSFVLNPHADARFTRCPRCERHTRLRKLPLVVHVDGAGLVILGKTCRLCVACEILIAHQAGVERLIAASMRNTQVGELKYLVLGTVGPAVWRRGLVGDVSLDDALQHMADFRAHVRVAFTPAGWNPKPGTLANNALQPTAARTEQVVSDSARRRRG